MYNIELLFFIETILGLDMEYSVVAENTTELEVCVVLFHPKLPCPIHFPFEISVYTIDDTASKPIYIYTLYFENLHVYFDSYIHVHLSTLGSDADYAALANPTLLRFVRCKIKECVSIHIINDEIVENTETFSVSLEESTGLNDKFELNPGQLFIDINDDDGMTV